jgi:uncharacterized OsmC-like protein
MRVSRVGPEQIELRDADHDGLSLEGEPFGAIELLATSLLVCSARVLETYATNVAKLSIAGLRLRAAWSLAERPARVEKLELDIVWPALPAERLDAARRAALTCTVHKTLESSPEITTRVTR